MAAAAKPSPAAGEPIGATQAARMAPAAVTSSEVDEARWRPVLGLPCQVTIDLPLPDFRVADFLGLRKGSVVPTRWRESREVPIRVNGTLIGWGEFEGSGSRLAVRLTELA